ncbi:T9SS type B sorting domain-containing protein [Psychroflexus planctonicus]|uniref:PKD domain-containing protein n=1 Tax=Psychroflexus planctonicus TaxID=1526575 RepID=A0ABQ1SIM7_9FLAO|nr:gliding motility-associated C-terminal domain-containing protein [Psychroflexus planctonicus]GGE41486.1 hypothetical protein GCM10010832_21910 [Psychroflexus planctonicus]
MIKKILFSFIFLFTLSITAQTTTVDCQSPLSDSFCYGNNDTSLLEFVSDDGSQLNLTFSAGIVEVGWDIITVLDSDGTVLFTGDGDLTGLTFQSSGDSISFEMDTDGSVSCDSGSFGEIEYDVVCATCTNPSVEFTQVNDCLNAPQFFIDVDVTDLGSASSIEITDSEGISTQTVTATGVVQVGPYPNGTNVSVDVQSLDDANCSVSSNVFSQEFCTLTEIECTQPFEGSYCYTNNDDTTLEFISEDGSPLNITFDAGDVEAGWDVINVFDSDGSVLFTGDGVIAGLTFQSTGDSISFQIISDGSVSCESGSRPEIEYTVNCATCTNPTVEFTQVNDCLNAPQFFVDVDITDLGSASSLEITDSEGISTETVTATGVVQVGPYPNGTNVTIDVQSLDDANCSVASNEFSQEFCTLNEVVCSSPFQDSYCYPNNDDTEIEFVSEDGSLLNLTFNAGNIDGFDNIIVFDSDGTTVLFDGDGDMTGLTFQSTGDSISFQITSSGFNSCETGQQPELDYTVTCATCENPSVEFEQVNDCLNAPQFFIDVDVTDLGSATSLEITDSEGVSTETVTETGIVQVGPYPNGSNVTVTVQSLDDANCSVNSSVFTQEFCTLTEVACDAPLNETFCYGENEDTTLEYISEDGAPLNLVFDEGTVEGGFDDLIVFDSDGTILFDGDGNLEGLSFQSSGDSISFQITSDGSVSCESGSQDEFVYTVTCATCVNQDVSFEIIDDCASGNDQFFIDVDVLDLGSATTLDITDNQGNEVLGVDAVGIEQFGPYPNGTNVEISVENVDDANCIIDSGNLTQTACPPDNTSCDTAEIAVVNQENLCVELNAGTLLQANATNVPSSCHPNITQDVWFEFEATAEVHTTTVIPENGSAFSPPFGSAIYADDCGNLTELYCSTEFDNFGNSNAIVAEGLTPGETYYVRIYNFGSAAAQDGNFDLCITTPQFFEDNDLCSDIEPFCAPVDDEGNPTPLVFPNGYFYLNENVAEDGPDYGCLGSEPNPAWFYLTVEESGDLEFELTQATAFDENGQVIGDLLDVDFIAYGPFSDVEDNCDQLNSANEVDCSYSPTSEEIMTIPNAIEGEVYVVLITNFNQSPGYISLNQTNINQPGGGSTNCDDVFGVVNGCASDGVTISSEVEDGTAYQWFILEDPEADPTDTSNYIPVEDGEEQDYLAVESGNYFVISQAQDNSFAEEFFTVRLSETPELDMDLEHNLCEGETLTLDATPINSDDYSSISYQWLDEDGPIDGATSPEFTFSDTGLHTLEITTEELLGSTNFECVNVFEININSSDYAIDLGGDQTFCENDDPQTITANLTGNVGEDADITYLWSTGEETESIEVSETGIYSVEVSVDGCVETAEVGYAFNAFPELDFNLNQNLCEGETFTLDATPINSDEYLSVNYQWSDQDGPVNGATNAEFTINNTGLYTVEITTEGSIGSTTYTCENTFEVNVSGAEYQIDLGGDLTFCDEEASQSLTADLVGNVEDDAVITYTWSTGENTETIQVSESGTYIVEVSVDGCVETAEVEYTFNQSPEIDLPTSVETCDLSSIVFDATPANVDATQTTFEWRLDGVLLQDEFMELVSADDYGFGTYELTAYSDSENCAFVQEIEVAPRFVSASLATDSFDDLFCVGEEVVIAADVSGAEGDDITYTWFVNGVEQPNQNQSEYVYEVGSDSTNPNQDVIALSVNVGGDCVANTAEVDLDRYELDNCIIPEGMSPDGVNHTLDLRFLADRSGIKSLEIYNRFGKSVFKQANYTDEFIGQNENGTSLVTGTYFYVIKFNQEDPVYGREHKGWIYINREQ